MNKLATLSILALSIGLAGCMGTSPAANFKGLETLHQPVVSRTNYTFDVATSGSGGLGAGEYQRLADWFDSLQLGYSDRISVDASSADNAEALEDAVGTIAARYGKLVSPGAPITNGRPSPGYARIVVSRASATVPGCPDWKSPPVGDAQRLPNWGCGVNSALAAMVANPEDLLSGRTGDSAVDANTNSKAIKTFREKPASGAQPLQAQPGSGGGNQ